MVTSYKYNLRSCLPRNTNSPRHNTRRCFGGIWTQHSQFLMFLQSAFPTKHPQNGARAQDLQPPAIDNKAEDTN